MKPPANDNGSDGLRPPPKVNVYGADMIIHGRTPGALGSFMLIRAILSPNGILLGDGLLAAQPHPECPPWREAKPAPIATTKRKRHLGVVRGGYVEEL